MPSVTELLDARFRAAMHDALGEDAARQDPLLAASTNARFGDYQANMAMSLAKRLNRKPRDVAQAIVDKMDAADLCDQVQIAGPGFINVRLKADFVAEQIDTMRRDERLGVAPVEPPHTVVVDYSSPNVAKEMHVGHLRSTIIGDCIARVLSCLGHKVVRQNHVGDWGTQFGMLVEYMVQHNTGQNETFEVADLNALYQQAKQKFDSDAAFADAARQRVVSLQGRDAETLRLWSSLVEESYRHFRRIYERLNVLLAPEDVRGESAYNDDLGPVVDELYRSGLAIESEGALCVFPEGFKDADGKPLPLIVRKRDGGYLYATTDLAAARYRIGTLGAQRIIYVTDARQSQHFAMVFAALGKAGWADAAVRLNHVPFGTLLGHDRRPFKTRSGEVVKLTDLLDEAQQRAAAVIKQKDPDMPAEQQQRIAAVVGIGAVKYADLSSDRIKDYVFDWDRMLALDGNTAPYLQNAYVRIRSIFRKGEFEPASLGDAPLAIGHDQERVLALKLLQYPAVVTAVAETLEPHRLCTYLYDLAAAFHQFYEQCRVLTAPDEPTRHSRLCLCHIAAQTLRGGLGLLGIDVVEQM